MIRVTGDTSVPHRRPGGEHPVLAERPGGEDDVIELSAGMLLVLDGDLQIVRASEAALREFPDLARRDGFLRLLEQGGAAEARQLRPVIGEAMARRARAVFLVRTERGERLICSLSPTPMGAPLQATAVLGSLFGGSERVVPHLKTIYRLSNAEGEIAAAAASGLDVPQIAQLRGVSIHTLRAQISAIKGKMGLSRMTEIATVVGRIEAAATWF